ncbi:hypothetical protein [Halococcus sp. PRR34]|uniref:hypothetical protein n=1 Tax=Halococcus sp. PRR34 TaxID=3020830 RepID=UPI0023625B9B|nr:hypothetical protein [Halococcus sp. PRR34]
MIPTQASRCEVFRTIAAAAYARWPAYDTTPLYDQSYERSPVVTAQNTLTLLQKRTGVG